jgi:hypothetical protein
MEIPKGLVADAAELLIWAQSKVGQILGPAPKPGKDVGRGRALALPDGNTIEPTARHRYRELAGIGAGLF